MTDGSSFYEINWKSKWKGEEEFPSPTQRSNSSKRFQNNSNLDRPLPITFHIGNYRTHDGGDDHVNIWQQTTSSIEMTVSPLTLIYLFKVDFRKVCGIWYCCNLPVGSLVSQAFTLFDHYQVSNITSVAVAGNKFFSFTSYLSRTYILISHMINVKNPGTQNFESKWRKWLKRY